MTKPKLQVVKIESEVDIVSLLIKLIESQPPKKLLTLIGAIYSQNASMGIRNDDYFDAGFALSYLMNHWDEAVKGGGEIFSKAMKKAMKNE